MAITASQASKLAGDARKYIHVAASLWPSSLINLSVGDIHADNPIVQVRVQKIYTYKCIYVPCMILGAYTRIYNKEYE